MTKFEVSYYAVVGEHGWAFQTDSFKEAIKEAHKLKRRCKKELGSEVLMIEVSGFMGEKDFAVVYMTPEYLLQIKADYFSSSDDYYTYREVAEKCIKTGKTVKGRY